MLFNATVPNRSELQKAKSERCHSRIEFQYQMSTARQYEEGHNERALKSDTKSLNKIDKEVWGREGGSSKGKG